MRPFSILICALCVAFEMPCPTWAARDEDEEEEVNIDGVKVLRTRQQVHVNASSMALPLQVQQDSSLMEQGFKVNLTAEDSGTASLEIAYRSLAEDCEVDPAKFTADVEGVQKLEKCVATLEDFSKKAKKHRAASQQLNNKYSKAFIETWGLLKQILDAHRKVKDLHMSAVMDQREAGANLARQLQGIRAELKTIVGPEMEFADLDEKPAGKPDAEDVEAGVEEHLNPTMDNAAGESQAEQKSNEDDLANEKHENSQEGEEGGNDEENGEAAALLAMKDHRQRTKALTVESSSKIRSRARERKQKRKHARNRRY